jgi:hypothetical protein
MSGLVRPKKVLLFGKTGDGKSTVANMLSSGELDGEFAAGNSLAAVTDETKEVTNPELNWTIIDTVGMFATDTPGEDQQRAKELRNYLAQNHPDIDIFCYVKKASRFTRADEQCWKAFNILFAGITPFHYNIVLVFTSCSEGPKWVEQHGDILNQHMPNPFGNTPYQKVAVDFPPRSDNSEVETQLSHTRQESLERLKALVNGSRSPVRLHELPESPRFLEKIIKGAKPIITNLLHGFHSNSRN